MNTNFFLLQENERKDSIVPHTKKNERKKEKELITRHFGKCLLQLLCDGLELLLLSNQLIFQSVNLLLQLLHRLLSKLGTSLSLLQSGCQGLDLLLVGLLPLVGLLLSHLQGLQVVGNNSQLLLKLHNLGLTSFSTLLSTVEICLTLLQLLGHLLILAVGILSLVSGVLQLLLELDHPLLISSALFCRSFFIRSE